VSTSQADQLSREYLHAADLVRRIVATLGNLSPENLCRSARALQLSLASLIRTFGETAMRAVALSFVAAVILAIPSTASAVQYESNGKVVHTRVAPVVMHRVSPPFRGQHVYSGRRGRW
jgi:hypothetical protein